MAAALIAAILAGILLLTAASRKWGLPVFKASLLIGAATGFAWLIAAAAARIGISTPFFIALLFVACQFSFFMGLLLILFYRDPERIPPCGLDDIAAPADGKVIYLRRLRSGNILHAVKNDAVMVLNELQDTALAREELWQIGIAMAFTDVHVNRAPIGGAITRVQHRPGKFLSLRRTAALDQNERQTIVIENESIQAAIVQIASRLVRRIEAYVKPGDTVAMGDRIGMIKFGSQVDLFLPASKISHVQVRVGQYVKAGETVLCRLESSAASSNRQRQECSADAPAELEQPAAAPLGNLGRGGHSRPRVCMVVFSHYPEDVRVRNEAEALVQSGAAVDVVCLVRDRSPSRERINGVDIHRISLHQERAGALRYICQYGLFLAAAFLKVSALHRSLAYDIVEVHNMPDILVLAGLLPKLTGARVILDLHDPMPELFMTLFQTGPSAPAIKLLKVLEKLSIRLADLVITTNISFRDLFVARGCPPSKIHIVMNAPQEDIFTQTKPEHQPDQEEAPAEFAIMHHGLIAERHGLDIAIEAMSYLRGKIPNPVLHIYGEGPFLEEIKALTHRLNLENQVRIHGFVAIEEIASIIPKMDLGIIPNRLGPFTNLNLPTRIFEFLRSGVPVIVPRTQGIRDYFDEDSIYYFEPANAQDLARVMYEVYSKPDRRRTVLARGRQVYQRHRWEYQRQHLVGLIRNEIRASKLDKRHSVT